jgi:hypothetical protein
VTALPPLPFHGAPARRRDGRQSTPKTPRAQRSSIDWTNIRCRRSGWPRRRVGGSTYRSAVEASPTAETVAAEAAQAAAQAAPESVSEFGQFGVPGGPESTESSTEFGAPAAQEAPADEAAAPAAPAATAKLVAGVDFAPPEPIASVLPRIQLTSSQADDLWALVCKRRRSNPNNDADAEVAKEIFAGADLANAVQQALQFYVRDVMFLSVIPQFRRRLKTLHNRVTQFLYFAAGT